MSFGDEPKEIMKIKIISDGTIRNTKFVDQETGKIIPVTSFTIFGNVKGNYVVVSMDIPKIALDIEANVEV